MKKLLTILLLLISCSILQGQSLYDQITINEKDRSVEELLRIIESKTELRFSYNSGLLAGKGKVTYQALNSPVNVVLKDILGPEISWKLKGKYVVLAKAEAKKKHFFIFGYIVDAETGNKLENVTIYEPISLASSLSDMNGYYKIRLLRTQNDIDLKYQKADYKIKVREIPTRYDRKYDVSLAKYMEAPRVILEVEAIEPIERKEDTIVVRNETKIEPNPVKVEPSIEKSPRFRLPDFSASRSTLDSSLKRGRENFMNWMMSSRQIFHSKNISDSLFKPFQVSLLPFVGTNLRLGPFVTNDYSFNIVAGYTGNVKKLEIGGAVNVVRKKMEGLQISGAINVVGEKMHGTQLAGAMNVNFDEAVGGQIAGVGNFTYGKSKGLQMAGAINFARNTHYGLQMAPMNYATELQGTQIGVFNFSEKITKGVPIGVFSYVRNGYRRWELNGSELNNTELTFKTGVQKLYNIFSTGYSYNVPSKPVFGFGYGLGSTWKLGSRVNSNIDFVAFSYIPQNLDFENVETWSQNYQVNVGLEYRFAKRLAIFAAPTLNFYRSFDESLNFSKYKLLISEKSLSGNFGPSTLYTWVGFKVGIRLCNKVKI